MSNRIFAETAPAYYARGVPVIPLHRRAKRPIPLDWSAFAEREVPEEIQKDWISSYPDGNIGLVLGKQAGVVMIDIDTKDEALIGLLEDLLPASPWRRVGQKGAVLAYRWNGTRTFRIKDARGESIVEHLSDRTQVVLPPSIHPDTQQPYVANRDLLDVIDHLPVLDQQIEAILRGALKAAGVELSVSGQSGVTDFVSRGSRDVTMTEKAGLFAYAVMRGERSLKEAIGMLQSFEGEFVEQVAGDATDIDKHVSNLLRFLRRDVIEKGKMLPEGWDEGLTDEQKEAWGVDFDRDHEAWDYDQLLTYLRDKFEQHPEESRGRADAVEHVLGRLAVQNLTKLDEERLLQYMTDVSGLRIKMTALRSRLRELRSGEISGLDHSEIAKGVLRDIEEVYTIRRHGGGLWKYIGSHWEPLTDTELMAKIAGEYGHLQAARRHSDHKGILATMMNLAEDGIKRSNTRGVNFANGFLTEDLELVEHDPDHGMVYTLPFRYLPEMSGKSYQFFEFLKDSWGEDPDYYDKMQALQEALCVTMFGMGPRYQRAVLLKGVPKSGKSQLLKVAQSLVPADAKCFVPPNEWHDKFMPTQMHEKLINVCGELSNKKKIDGQKFKDIIDGAEMSGQLKGQQIFKFSPICTHWFASNHAPKTEDSSEGFNRRWLILEFNRKVPPERRQVDLGDVIVADEREAIVAWAVQAMGRLRENNEFTLPSSHVQLIREMAQANNSVLFFLEESPKVRVVADSGNSLARISEHRLFKEYWSFCLGPGGAKPVSSRAFRAMMRELQSTLGFVLKVERTETGQQAVYYESLTLADREGTP